MRKHEYPYPSLSKPIDDMLGKHNESDTILFNRNVLTETKTTLPPDHNPNNLFYKI